ncbi:PREDICTED: uncharacterized protein LOC109481302, partial [Branchiostoma belcheri]|uniref:Uncharacterized protein LOC109481302 n=1 Tax=Branchiostoma belcheri TaxID=7741 RepID=A0A6P4ZZD4_BRABE
HVAPEETEHYKSDEKALGVGRKEASIQDDLGKADVVFSVGPRIQRHYARFLRQHKVAHHIFLPEPSKVFSDANVSFGEEGDVRKPERVILSIGRVLNVERLKGHDLAAGGVDKAALRLDHLYTLRLRVRGIDENDFKESKRILDEKLRSGRVKPTLLPYGTQKEIRRDMENCHLVLMPSRAEPFGLVGLEAIAAGVPVLISEHSGLAELIEELSDSLEQPTFRHCIVKMKGNDATTDEEKWAERIEDVIKNARSEFEEARAFKEKLLASKYWEESHQKFLQACGITVHTPRASIPASTPAEKPDQRSLIETLEEGESCSQLEQPSLTQTVTPTAPIPAGKQVDTPRKPQTDDMKHSAVKAEEKATDMTDGDESSKRVEKRPLLAQSGRAPATKSPTRLLQQEEIELEDLAVTEETRLSPAGEEQGETGETQTVGDRACCPRCPHCTCSVL